MDGVGLVSCHRFNGRISPINSEHSACIESTDLHSSTEITSDIVNEVHSECISTATSKPACAAYDEDFEVNGEEEVSTPRTSPTLVELRKMLDDLKPMTPKNYRLGDRGDSIISSPKFILRSLKEVATRPCQYPLDKFYDEAIPVRSLLMKSVRLNHDKVSTTDNSTRNRSIVSHPPVRCLDNILTCPTSPLPRLSSYCSSSGSLIGNINGIPLPEDNLFLSDNLFPPTLSKSLFEDSKRNPSNGYENGQCSNTGSDAEKCEPDVRHLDHDNVSEESAFLTPSDDASSPGTTLISVKTNKSSSSRSPSSPSSLRNDSSHKNSANSDVHLSFPTLKLPRQTSKSKHSKRSKASSQAYIHPGESTCNQNSDKPEVPCDTESTAKDAGIATIASIDQLLPSYLPATASLREEHSVDNKTNPVLEGGDAHFANNNVHNHESRSPSAFSRVHVQEDMSADGDFTLVTNKKSRRKLKLEKQQLESQLRTPASPTVRVQLSPVANSSTNRISVATRSSSSTSFRGSFRRPCANSGTSYHKLAPPPTNAKASVGTYRGTLHKNASYRTPPCSSNTSDGASVSGQSDRSVDSHAFHAPNPNLQNPNYKSQVHSVCLPALSSSQVDTKPGDGNKYNATVSKTSPISAYQHHVLARFLMSTWNSFANEISVS